MPIIDESTMPSASFRGVPHGCADRPAIAIVPIVLRLIIALRGRPAGCRRVRAGCRAVNRQRNNVRHTLISASTRQPSVGMVYSLTRYVSINANIALQ